MKSDVLSVPFYKFYYPEEKRDGVLQTLKGLSYRHNDTNWIWDGVPLDGVGGSDLYNIPDLKDLFDWMQDCMAEIEEDMGITTNMVCNSAWANLNKTGEWFFDHTHSNCFMSSNYYASGDYNDVTHWVHPNPWFHYSNIWPCGAWTEEKYNLVHNEPTEAGKFIVFPPAIQHRALPNTSKDDRITIAANWFPTGLINASGVSHLNVKVIQ
jgi:hypothetical protein|tara:strand:- start:25599 stop:26228 length:630 start_codon:yes stop_codon:yes gene_type:complete